MNYNNYLQTPHWQSKRQVKLTQKPICQICESSSNLHIHHKRYSRHDQSILFNERPQDLITLCASCHRLMHKYLFGHPKLNKMILRVKRLIKLGAKKNKAFWVVNQGELFGAVRDQVLGVSTNKTLNNA